MESLVINAVNVMNSIPITFNEDQVNATVLGGMARDTENCLDVSIILLNSQGSHLKMQVFEELTKCNFKSIVSVEPDSQNFSLEELSRKYPSVKFIMPLEKVNAGQMVNMAVKEIDSEYFFVIKDSVYIPQGFITPKLIENLMSYKKFCVVPRLVNSDKDGIAQVKVPSAQKSRLVVESRTHVTDGMKTLYPFDCIGLFDRQKFLQLGGYDYTIKSEYWQNLDLGLRSWLWGEETVLTTNLQLSYVDSVPLEDKTPSLDSLRFYLKNQLPKFQSDHGYASRLFFWRFFIHSSCGLVEAVRQFNDALHWIFTNRYRFTKDLKMLVEEW